MAKGTNLPNIPEEEQTPLIKSLLGIVEQLAEKVQLQEEEIQQLKDEISVLKGEKKRPTFKPSKMDQEAGKDKDEKDEGKAAGKDGGKRSGSEKKHKTPQLKIHDEKVRKPSEPIPAGSRFKGYRDFVVQDLVIRAHNTRYRLERWETPDGETLAGRLPESLEGRHFGPELMSYVLYQHHHCQVTQPLLLEQLREWGIDISSGTINDLLLRDKARFHREKDELLLAGLSNSNYVTVDDTGARHQGKNGYVTHIGNEFFAWFKSTESKSRINFLELLRAHHSDYLINDEALTYMQQQRLPKQPLERLRDHCLQGFPDPASWEAHLDRLKINKARHRRIATEGALLGSILHHGFSPTLAIVSDDAGQFNILLHALCWVHAERLVHKLIPLNDQHREDIARVRGQIWSLYADLKTYKIQPTMAHKEELQARFDTIFTQKTRFETLNRMLKRIYRNKSELLLVLDHPDIPLHTNGSEGDIRDYVKKKKVSGGTRSDLGRRCRDTFASLKKTCRKLGISFWDYLSDRVSGSNNIPLLPEIVCQRLANP
jgi:hypothetical protein